MEFADWDRRGNLAVVHFVGGKHRLEYPVGKVLYETSGWISDMRLSPEEDKIAFLDHPVWPDDRGTVAVVDMNGQRTTVSQEWESERGLAWGPHGKEIWFTAASAGSGNALYATTTAAKTRLILQAPGDLMLHDVSPSGRVLASFDKIRAGLWGLSGGNPKERDLTWFTFTFPADISADGRTMVLWDSSDPAGPNYVVGIKKMDGSPPIRLGEGYAGGPSPDGQWVISVLPGLHEQVILLPTGPGEPKRLDLRPGIDHVTQSSVPVFFTDGKRLLVNGNEVGRATRTYVVDIASGKARAVTPEGIMASTPSPDGKYVAGLDAENRLVLYPVDGGEPRVVPRVKSGLTPLKWSNDGQALYAIRYGEMPLRVTRVILQTGQEKSVRQITPPTVPGVLDNTGVRITPDGNSLAYGYRQIVSDLYLVDGLR